MTYTKTISNPILNLVKREEIIFNQITFEKQKTKDRLDGQTLEVFQIYDPNLFKKLEHLKNCSQFIKKYDYLRFQKKVKFIKSQNFDPSFCLLRKRVSVHEITQEFYGPLINFMLNHQKKPKIQFKKIKQNHIDFYKKMMKTRKTKNLTIMVKRKLLMHQFPNLNVSYSTCWKIQRIALNYSFKRICQYVPKSVGNKELRRVYYIKEFLKNIQNSNTMMFIIDEMGIGTNPLRHYGYSYVGTPATTHQKSHLSKNLTCIGTISLNGMEYLEFIYGGGTKNETFLKFFKELSKAMEEKYPDKKLVFVLDNLWAHKSSLIVDFIKFKKNLSLLLTPSNTPQFSPIENLFGYLKRKLIDFEFKKGIKGLGKRDELAFQVQKVMFSVPKHTFEGFFKKTFQNFLVFWHKLQRDDYLKLIDEIEQEEDQQIPQQ